MNPIKHIPNFITCLNLLSGCLAIISVVLGNPLVAAYWVIAAAIFDFFDGFAARILNVSSPIGAQLDSLADMVTFGVVPGLLLLHYLSGGILNLSGVGSFVENPIFLVFPMIPVFNPKVSKLAILNF